MPDKSNSMLAQLVSDSEEQQKEEIEQITDKQKDELYEKAKELLQVNESIKECMKLMKKLNGDKNRLALQEIPSILHEWNQEGVTYKDLKIDLKFDLYGSFPKVKEDGDTTKVDNAVEELSRFEGGKDIITNQMVINFARGKMELVDKIAHELIEQGFKPNVSSTVHHATLKSFVKKRIEDTDINPPLVGLFARTVANVTERKQ